MSFPRSARAILACGALFACDRASVPETDVDLVETDTVDTDPVDPGLTRVDTGGSVARRSVDVAVGPGGVIYVSWVTEGDSGGDVYVARSTDGGASFGAPVVIDDGGSDPMVTMARRPYVIADADRVVVVFIADAAIHVASSSTDALSFEAVTLTLDELLVDNVDFARAALVDGEIHLAWQAYDPTGWIASARESAGFEPVQIDASIAGIPCECCPLDLAGTSAGELIVAFRNNDDDIREHHFARLVDGAVAAVGPISDTEGELVYCPMEGPRLALTSDTYYAVWSSAVGTEQTWVSSSSDGGTTWTPEIAAFETTGTSAADVAVTSTGVLWVTTETDNGTLVTYSPDGATYGEGDTLLTPDGPLVFGQLSTDGATVVVAGATDTGTAWLYRAE